MYVDNFAILALVGLIVPITMPWPMEIFGTQVRVGPHRTPIVSYNERSVPSPSHHGEIPFAILSILALFWLCQNTPFSKHNFSPPCGQLAAPYRYAHEEPGPNSKSCT